MAFKQVIDLDCATSTAIGGVDKKSGKKNPTSVEGYFIGSRDVESKKSKTGLAKLHVFQTSAGNQGVWGKTDLDQKLARVTPGTMTRVTFTGMQETKNNPMYKYRVETDDENVIDVGTPGNGSEDSNEEASEGFQSADAYEEESALDGEEEQLDEQPAPRALPPRQAAQAPSAERQAKVNALLNRSRNKSV